MEKFSSQLYDKKGTGNDTMGPRMFMIAITAFTAAFAIVAMVGSSISYEWTFGGHQWLYILFMVACVAVAIAGGAWAHRVDDPGISLLGGSICAIAIGLMIGPFVALFEAGSVAQAFVLAAIVVFVTGFVGAALPQNLASWGAPLFGLLVGAIIIQFGGIALQAFGVNFQPVFTILDWAILILFCFIMIYDLNRARHLDKTLDNAIDVAVSVFMNFANIFIRILSIMGQRK